MTIYEQVKMIYWNLRKMKEQNQQIFCENEYKWVIGYQNAEELSITKNMFTAKRIAEEIFLFGIEVEIDHLNPDNIRIYEDITNKIIN